MTEQATHATSTTTRGTSMPDLFFEPPPCNSTAVLSSTEPVHSGDYAATCLPARALYAAQLLIGAVRDNSSDGVARILSDLDAQGLHDVAVTLAALVPYDKSLRELLAWNDDQWSIAPRQRARRLRPHGTHAGFNRHKKRGEQPCSECTDGERIYQRQRPRRRLQPAAEAIS